MNIAIEGKYELRAFAISNFISPQILTAAGSTTVNVRYMRKRAFIQ